MRGGDLIREARKRSRLTQRELAERLGTTQGVIARWETGRSSPTFERLHRAVKACGFDLSVRIVPGDDQHALLIEETLRLTPQQRLDRLFGHIQALDDLTAGIKRSGV
ncbi:MAG TPA: helix-turn-helix transcriptional regulator [Actinomycetota bacterium]|jgi:transcriptional regulator with XRE-family HTH domain